MANYKKIYEYLSTRAGKVITPSMMSIRVGERIYGATMAKLVRDGYIEPCAAKGYYRVNENIKKV